MQHPDRGGSPISRRTFLAAGTAAAGLALSSPAGRLVEAAAAVEPSRARGIKEIEHVVILMQENRSFDHYFGTLSGVRGFSDPRVPQAACRPEAVPDLRPVRLRAGHRRRPDGVPAALPSSERPAHRGRRDDQRHHPLLGTPAPELERWGHGPVRLDPHRHGQRRARQRIRHHGLLHARDLAFYYALADAFCICDGYHCSVLGPDRPQPGHVGVGHHRSRRHQGRARRRDLQRPGAELRNVQLGDHARGTVRRWGELEGLQRPHRPPRAEPLPLLLPVLGLVGETRAGGQRHHPHLSGFVRGRCRRRHPALRLVDHAAVGRVRTPGGAPRVRRVPHQPGALDPRLQP